MQRVAVLTGGPGAGKTTLLQALAARGDAGVAIVPEAAIQVIDGLIAETGSVEGSRAWRTANLLEFQLRIARKQVALEQAARASAAELVFCDRGLIDGLAYLARRGEDVPTELRALVEAARYDAVFLLATLTRFDERADSGRISTRTDSLELADALRDAYAERGHTVIDVPEATVDERVALVLDQLGSVAR